MWYYFYFKGIIMSKIKFILLIASFFVISHSNLFSADSLQIENTKIYERPVNLPDIKLYPDYKMIFYYDGDNQFELAEENYQIVFVIADYLISNPDRSVSLRAWQHENETKGTASKRIQYIKDVLIQAGANPNRIISKFERPSIPQDPSDIFTADELIQARRVDVAIIR